MHVNYLDVCVPDVRQCCDGLFLVVPSETSDRAKFPDSFKLLFEMRRDAYSRAVWRDKLILDREDGAVPRCKLTCSPVAFFRAIVALVAFSLFFDQRTNESMASSARDHTAKPVR